MKKNILILSASSTSDITICATMTKLIHKSFVVDGFFRYLPQDVLQYRSVKFIRRHAPESGFKRKIDMFVFIRRARKLIKSGKYDKVLFEVGDGTFPLNFVFSRFFQGTEKILFKYDLVNAEEFRNGGLFAKFLFYVDKLSEKRLLINSDKIIHKGSDDEITLLPFYKSLKAKPCFLFQTYIDANFAAAFKPLEKLSKKDGVFHVVFTGPLALLDEPSTDSIWTLVPKITRHKIHFHLYGPYDKKAQVKIKKLEKKNPYFHFWGFCERSILVRKISQYDYGLLPMYNRSKTKNLFVRNSRANKLFDYLIAGLPVIYSDDAKAVKEYATKYGVGFSTDYSTLDSLKSDIEKEQRVQEHTLKNIKKAIPVFSDPTEFIAFLNR